MVRGWMDVRKIVNPVRYSAVDDDVDAPDVINATDVEQHIDYVPPLTGFSVQNLGPKPSFIRINGTAGTADNTYHVKLAKNEAATFSSLVIGKISSICAASETAKLIIAPSTEAP